VLLDGIFHATFLAVLLVGIVMLTGRRVELRSLVGHGLVGSGVFHVLDHVVFTWPCRPRDS
jgi:uncharacterized membrane protein